MLAVSRQFWAIPLRRREERVLTFLSPAPFGVAVAVAVCVPTKARVLSISRGTQGPTIHLFGACSHDCYFELPARRGGRLPTQAVGSSFRPRNDSGSPTPSPCTVARTSTPRATSDTISWPAFAPPLLSPARDACAPPGGDRSGPTRHPCAPPTAPLPPARIAAT